jgi:hypothetical protein
MQAQRSGTGLALPVLISTLDGVGGQSHSAAATMVLTAWEAGLDQAQSGDVRRRAISSPTEVRTSDHPARSKSLYRIRTKPRVFNTRCE